MQLRVPDSPFELSDDDRHGVETFEDYFWHSSEVCNNCFQQVRSVGEKITRPLNESKDSRHLKDGPPLELEINTYYERTDRGSQEHTTWDDNKRFGTCFCLDCGADCTANHGGKSLMELKPLAANIARYTRRHTPLSLDAEAFAGELIDLKRTPKYQDYETEMLALAFARGVEME